MNIRYTTVTAALCCALLSSGCAYDKKRIVSSGNAGASTQGLETTEDLGSKPIIQPYPNGINDDFQSQYNSGQQGSVGFSEEGPVLPEMQYVKDRIFEYGRKLDRWKELDDQAIVLDLDEAASEEMVRCFRDLQKF